VNGNSAAEYTSARVIIKYYRNASDYYHHNQGLTGTHCTVKVTSYGNAGEVVEGTFSGELIHTGDSNTHTLTNGSFKLIRNN